MIGRRTADGEIVRSHGSKSNSVLPTGLMFFSLYLFEMMLIFAIEGVRNDEKIVYIKHIFEND